MTVAPGWLGDRSWRRRLLRWSTHPLLIAVALLLTSMAWVVASPLGAEPDADFHLTSIWCQNASESSRCERGYLVNGDVAVKTYAAFDIPCFARYQWKSASCQKITTATYYTERVNDGDYPPGFYWVMGLFASHKVVVSVLVMRTLNALLFLGLIGSVFWLADPRVRQSMARALTIALVPMGLFLISSINPSTWAITGIAVQFFALLAIGEARGRWRPIVLALLATLGGAMAAEARGDAGAYAGGVSILVAWLAFPLIKERRWRWVGFLLPALFGLLTFFGSRQTTGEIGGSSSREPDAFNLFHILSVPLGNFGIGGNLGWLDTPTPPATWALMLFVFGAVLLTEIRGLGWRRALAATGVGIAALALPYLMLQRGGFAVGEFVQPRYMLPLLIVLLGVITWRSEDRLPSRDAVPAVAVVVALTIAQSAALYANLLRYTNGFVPYLLGAEVDWWWPTPIGPQAVWIVGSLAFGFVVAALLYRVGPGQLPPVGGAGDQQSRAAELKKATAA